MKYCFRIFILSLILQSNLWSQRLVKVNVNTPICAVGGDNEAPKNRFADAPSKEAQDIINDICRKIGVSSKSFTLEAANVKNAEALILNEQRYIHYNPLYVRKLRIEGQTDWSMIFVLAHEIGHHINGDLLINSDYEKSQIDELAADKFAGCALARLGASLDDVKKAALILNETGDNSHPPRDTRIVMAIRGWEDCQAPKPPEVPPPHLDCQNKKTNDVYFKNDTKGRIMVYFSPQAGWRDTQKFITIDAGDTKPFLDLNIGVNYFEIHALYDSALRSLNGDKHFAFYKNEQLRVDPCADYEKKPITIK
jgi:hypothetical protein